MGDQLKTNQRPEAWLAQCLREESERLTVAVRALEWQEGYSAGLVS